MAFTEEVNYLIEENLKRREVKEGYATPFRVLTTTDNNGNQTIITTLLKTADDKNLFRVIHSHERKVCLSYKYLFSVYRQIIISKHRMARYCDNDQQ